MEKKELADVTFARQHCLPSQIQLKPCGITSDQSMHAVNEGGEMVLSPIAFPRYWTPKDHMSWLCNII